MIISAESVAALAVPPAAAIPAADVTRLITTVIAAGNAAGLFPVIAPAAAVAPKMNSTTSTRAVAGSLPPGASPTATPSPIPATGPQTAERSLGPAADASATSSKPQVLALGLIAVALSIMLATTRILARKRTKTDSPGS